MTKPIDRDPIYRRRALDADIIELCCWYVRDEMDHQIRPGILETLESARQGSQFLMAGR